MIVKTSEEKQEKGQIEEVKKFNMKYRILNQFHNEILQKNDNYHFYNRHYLNNTCHVFL